MKDKLVLMVTGASSDIGMKLIEQVEERYTLILAHYTHMNEKLEALKARLGDKLELIQADFTDESSITGLVEELQQKDRIVDHFVHLAADRVRLIPYRKLTWDEIQKGIDISTKSVFLLLKPLLHKMVKQKYGKVIFMLSSNVCGQPASNQTAYILAKYSELGLLKSLEVDYSPRGILFNAISPDMIDTKFLSELPQLVVEQNRQNSSLSRNLSIEEIVSVLSYLLSSAGDAIKNTNIPIFNR